ncbi:MAG: excinuclease ABC subunit A [Rhodospirillaceae bacterium]|nr:excinuclease ABC subunit A [Rhodospirillaceae bacterium]|tara:strand:- start:659 stop:3514 length:2856 start_codon:yes stop_codon:yes gene_type:complete
MVKTRTDQLLNKEISIRGAKEHNLKSVNLDIPKESIVVFTGISGSGKSSLAFDTIYAEGQRRYVESLSAYARQFLELMQKPEVDSITGLSPAISIEQKTTSKNPRSTVGTVTEIYDYLRLLYARVGIPYSPATNKPIKSQSVSEIVDRILQKKEKTKLYLLSPIIRGRKGEFKKLFSELQKKGYQRLKIDGEIYEIDELPDLNKKIKHNIEAVIDRIVISKNIKTRLSDSVEICLNESEGLIIVEEVDSGNTETFSSKFACPVSGFTIEEIEPRLFSFNNPFGACDECDGLGTDIYFDPKLIIPDESLSLNDGAISPWSNSYSQYYNQTIDSITKHFKISKDTPWVKIPENVKNVFLYGSQNKKIIMKYLDNESIYQTKKIFEGIIPNMQRRWVETESSWKRDEISKYQNVRVCKKCNGLRLKEEALCVKINKLNIGEVTNFTIKDALDWFSNLNKFFNKKERTISARITKEITERLNFLVNVGLGYLNLSRTSGTLSGGESQRIRLASQIGSGLTGVLYVLDEPSIGLHQRDNQKLLKTLKNLRNLGNTVIVVEHDEEAILEADYVVDIGPGAGVNGGEIISQGKPQQILKDNKSLTGKYLSGKLSIPIPTTRRINKDKRQIKIVGAKENNLKNISVTIPLGTFVCVTGVSGSGKSTLIIETLYKSLSKNLNNSRLTPGKYSKIEGLHFIDKIVDINQSPIGRTPRSNPATYTGAFTPIRDWFANLPESRQRGYKAGRFSFNVRGGRCEACQGDGLVKIEMHFLPDVFVKCDVCNGLRYNRETLEIKYKNKSIADILDMSVDEANIFFDSIPAIREKMKKLQEVGLGYIKIGQQATTLSGGEAQRIKLSKELAKRATGKTLYILDEPTTGLHFDDINKLLIVLHKLVSQGNSVIVIEHNLDVIKTADWLIDLGPDGGNNGGEVVATGSPEDICKVNKSYTGKYLKKYLKK